LTVPMAYIFAFTIHLGLKGVWMGIVVGNTIAAFIAFSWAKMYVRKMEH